ncbi:GNAT family N-acetyltransferase [Corallococcus sp. M34]|uniref:GNAT family N-acetyltransferase n=1 Tax=Citreicoccus inhibens TaxID=2849499 RepID=UPI001C228528|nr:GNAT family N-acetyltransferase [Citreicoccus inhibens]MBU8896136.1 GNAT family N-acetyltransferase [Citreicoccus inhibens]
MARQPPAADALLDLLDTLPHGHRLWVRGAGRSLYPLLRSGDAVRVQRCGMESLAPGDVALVRRGRQLTAHVVCSTEPWTTASLLGNLDPPGGEPLGRVVAVRRGRVVLPLPRPSRPALWLAHRGLSAIWARPRARVVYRHVRDFFFSGWSLPLRRLFVGTLSVRLLREEDLDALLVFAGEGLVVSASFLRRQLRERWGLRPEERAGAAVGAFDDSGRLHGFAWVDDYRQEGLALEGLWVRSLVVAPRARRMGVASGLVRCLLDEARRQGADRVRADIDEDNTASLRTFRGLGFRPAPPSLTQRTNQEWDAAGGSKRLVVLERVFED